MSDHPGEEDAWDLHRSARVMLEQFLESPGRHQADPIPLGMSLLSRETEALAAVSRCRLGGDLDTPASSLAGLGEFLPRVSAACSALCSGVLASYPTALCEPPPADDEAACLLHDALDSLSDQVGELTALLNSQWESPRSDEALSAGGLETIVARLEGIRFGLVTGMGLAGKQAET